MRQIDSPADEAALERLLRDEARGPAYLPAASPWYFVYDEWPEAYFVDDGFTPYDLAARLARISGVSRDQLSADVRRWLRGDARDRVLEQLNADRPASSNKGG